MKPYVTVSTITNLLQNDSKMNVLFTLLIVFLLLFLLCVCFVQRYFVNRLDEISGNLENLEKKEKERNLKKEIDDSTNKYDGFLKRK